MDAPVHPNCSFAWRSILQALEVINRGAIWRVGNGLSIDIWNHRWLSEHGESKVVSPRQGAKISRVHELFYLDTRVWDPSLLERCFLPWEAEMIKQIYVHDGDGEDVLVWPLTPDGNYSVRSAYCMLATEGISQNPSSSSPSDAKRVWKGIWKIKTPNKIRHFIWRAAKDSLPTKQNLKVKHIPLDDTCAMCDDHPESLLHCLWLCPHAQSVWRSEITFANLYTRKHRSFFYLLDDEMQNNSSYHVALFSTIA